MSIYTALHLKTMKVKIRNESSADIEAIDQVITEAFFNASHTSHTEQFIVKALRRNNKLTLSLIAEIDEHIVGHVAVSPIIISDGCLDWYGLGPVSVALSYQGQGVGTLLVQQALSTLRTNKASGCVVLGDPKYYSRFGFQLEPTLELPDVPPEYFQALSFSGTVPNGYVSYDDSFNACD